MRSLLLCVLCIGIFSTGVHGQEIILQRTVEVGESFNISLFWPEAIERCYLESPYDKNVEFIPNDESNEKYQLLPLREFYECSAIIKDLDESDSGVWTLHAQYVTQRNVSQSYNLTVYTPEVTTEMDDRHVTYLPTQFINTTIGSIHQITIPKYDFVETDSCHLLTASGMQYNMQGMNIAGVKVISNSEVACGVEVNVESENLIGNWTLIQKGTNPENFEKRLPFTVHVEEFVEASVNQVTLVEGKDLYIRLKNPIANYDTCRLIGSDGNEPHALEKDSRYTDSCGYIVRSLKTTDSGSWEITYGDRILYRAIVQVTVTAAPQATTLVLDWTRDRPVQTSVGPEDAVYCRVVNPMGYVVFEGFGTCNISLDRVTMEHNGVWTMSVGVAGQVLPDESQFIVNVVEAVPKPTVTTSVVSEKPIVSLSCSVSSPNPIRACKFREPSGRILLASEGVGESRYSFHGAGVSYQSGLHTHDCGIQITNPVVQDLGLWRCAMETEEETYYGFLSVLCPFAMSDPEVAAQVVSEPVLTADRDAISTIAGESVTMTCSVQSAISYCYIRAPNGTVFNVGPNHPHDQATYVGAGFDAGECGIRFPSLSADANGGGHQGNTHTGTWSCHVGFPDVNKPQQRANIVLTIRDLMNAEQRVNDGRLFVEAYVHDNRALEYCRFVRMDGYGFIAGTANMPSGYFSTSNHAIGQCGIQVASPSILDLHPWTVVAKIMGQDVEITRVTSHSFQLGPADDEETITIYYRMPVIWIVVMALGLSMILIAMLIGPKKHREWTRARAARISSSFRNSFSRKAVVPENVTEKNSPMAA